MASPHIYYSLPLRCWVLGDDWTVNLNGHDLTLYKGWLTDLASVPRILWGIVSSFELGTAPLTHDWGYQHQGAMSPDLCWTRRQIDQFFLRQMTEEGVGWVRRYAYAAVRMFGWIPWQKKRKDRLPRATKRRNK